jgi:hypothetical protein
LLQQIASQRIESPPTSEEEKPAEASAGAEAVEDEVEVPTPEVSTPAEVPEPTFWVWVSGSRWVSDSDREAALVVARLLSEEGCGLITCGRYGIDEIVAESFSFAVQQQHGQDGVRRYLRLVFGTEEQKTVEGGAVIQAGTNEEQLTLCAQQADAVILIGGVNGPISVTEAAQSANKSVLPLASTGGAAEEMFNRLVSWRERGEGNQYPLTA